MKPRGSLDYSSAYSKLSTDTLLSSTSLTRARSVDFSRLQSRASFSRLNDPATFASQFSRRAARIGTNISLTQDEADSLPYLPMSCKKVDHFPQKRDVWPRVESEPWNTVDEELEPNRSFIMRIPLRTFTVGKLSVFILIIATLIDFAFSRIVQLDTFRPIVGSSTRVRTSLGSAAISSVTEVLSPILPFTGGVDLRREDYWKTSGGSWFDSVQSVTRQLRDAFESSDRASASAVDKVPRGGGNVPARLAGRKTSTRTHETPISAATPFVSVDAIAELTLGDLAETFRYVVESGKKGYNEAKFLNALQPHVKKIIAAMEAAVQKSRGKFAKPFLACESGSASGDMDALKFAAAMRVFAEWRLARLVPDGYKGYAVGMGLGHKDVVQNLVKIEQTVHNWLDTRSDLIELQSQWEETGGANNCNADGTIPNELRSPSLREILEFEIEMDINPLNRLPRLKDKSAAMGLLWVRRQLHYQMRVFSNVLKVPKVFASSKDAVSAAYSEVYDKYHGWAVQKIFNYSFQAAPEAEEIYRHMNPHKLREVSGLASKLKPKTGSENSWEDASMSSSAATNPVDAFLRTMAYEWNKIFNGEAEEASLVVRGGGSAGIASATAEAEEFITEEMIKDAHSNIAVFLGVTDSVLDDLASLFDTMNMDDPTRV